MNIFQIITGVAALVAFAAAGVLVLALMCGARVAWRDRQTGARIRRARGQLLRDYWAGRVA